MNRIATAAAIALAAASALATPGTIRTANEQRSGDVKWQAAKKQYLLVIKDKSGSEMSFSYAPEDIVSLDVPEPASYKALVSAVQGGRGTGAIQGLTAIVQEYKKLNWDKPAARWLVEAYLQANNPQKAYEMAQTMINEDKSYAYTGDLAPAYWQVLLKLGKTQQLENCLAKAAASGDRLASANALVMRGDVILANGSDNAETYRKALIDAYLRVALMYTDEASAPARAAACEKCALCFENIGWTQYAEEMRSNARSIQFSEQLRSGAKGGK